MEALGNQMMAQDPCLVVCSWDQLPGYPPTSGQIFFRLSIENSFGNEHLLMLTPLFPEAFSMEG